MDVSKHEEFLAPHQLAILRGKMMVNDVSFGTVLGAETKQYIRGIARSTVPRLVDPVLFFLMFSYVFFVEVESFISALGLMG
jgi:hypothetical protein